MLDITSLYNTVDDKFIQEMNQCLVENAGSKVLTEHDIGYYVQEVSKSATKSKRVKSLPYNLVIVLGHEFANNIGFNVGDRVVASYIRTNHSILLKKIGSSTSSIGIKIQKTSTGKQLKITVSSPIKAPQPTKKITNFFVRNNEILVRL